MEVAAWRGLRDVLLRLWQRRDPSPDAALPLPTHVATLAPPSPTHTVPAPPSLFRPSPFRSPAQPTSPGQVRSPGQSRSPGQIRSPGQPRSPGQIRSPGQPRSPGQIRSPGQPRSPGQSRSTGQTRSPGQPITPGQSMSTGQPRSPVQHRSIGQPRSPGQPMSQFQLRSQGQPISQGQPMSTGQPSLTRQHRPIGQPRSPGQPRSQGQPTSPGQPSSTGQHRSIGQPSSTGQPRSPVLHRPIGQPSSPGQPRSQSQPMSTVQPRSPVLHRPIGQPRSPGQDKSPGGQPRSPLSAPAPVLTPGSPRPGRASALSDGKEEGEETGSGSWCEEGEEIIPGAGQEQLESIIRTRGYIVKEHLPRRILEHQVMANIRRRERIARILREEEARAAPAVPEKPATSSHRSHEMITLLAKVWSGRGASVETAGGPNEVEWSRSQFVQECVSEHNRLRALHSAPPLLLSDQLCRSAQSWANRLAHFGLMEYKSEHGRGENILTSTAKESMSGIAVARAWYETGRNYNYEMNGPADLSQAGPFSQVVWADTRAIGVGVARGSSGRSVVVARYWPPGNVAGQFIANVQRPQGQPPSSPYPRKKTPSRTRQEAAFYVRMALEPPGKKAERPRLATLPAAKKFISGGITGHTILGGPVLAATLSSCRNGAARTSRLLPVCCLSPPRPQPRWAQPSARSRLVTDQDTALALAVVREDCTDLETARLSPDLPPSDSPIHFPSPKVGLSFAQASPRTVSSWAPSTPHLSHGSPKIHGSSRFALSPRRGSPKHGSPRRGSPRCGSPKCGSPRRVVGGRAGVGSRRSPMSRVSGVSGAGVVSSTL